ncbi:Cyclin mcs2 [Taphrina deformans PYCC 5710]|uniref:Cyclin mcs2 n=1 Tax=Taphrina deformans (strain PYCC 5710 / ATCC 11124 / CBS 356.35 / IMI 108563 / JCM 9778 / NBRC 8474) TaxID=1097556 RepID=R4X964_TAPDE|nr:Cyclin mcs2 [Taphrina deformans PYCC 5710]|eukprot:CCG80712.1 Cyclin mcs2 [Taphrina deformans PYCC 5710]
MPTAVATVYEESSQHKRWTFQRDDLVTKRQSLNEATVSLVKENIQEDLEISGNAPAKDPEFPNTEEELLIVNYYAAKVYDTGAVFTLPSHLKATAAAYLKRFYLVKSPLQYHPKSIMITSLFLATKTCEHHVDLDTFVAKFPKQTKESVLEHEFMISSTIGFDFVHWSAYRPLYGFVLDIESTVDSEDGHQKSGKARVARSSRMHDTAKSLINATIWSDLPFLYSPSDLALAALHKADADFLAQYLNIKGLSKLLPFLDTIGTELIEVSKTRFDGPEVMAKVKAADRKLYYSSDPALKPGSALYKKRAEDRAEENTTKRLKKSEASRENLGTFGDILS